MGIVYRQSIKAALVIFIGAVMGGVINLIYTYIFSKPELGLLTNLTNQAAIMQIVLLAGGANLLATYFPRQPEDGPKRKVLITICLALPLIATATFTILYIIFRSTIIGFYQTEDQAYISRFYLWLPVITLGWAYTTLLDYYLISRMKAAIGAVMREVVLRLCLIGLILLFFFRVIDFNIFIVLMSLMYLVPAALSLWIAKRTGDFGLSFNLKAFSKKEYQQLFHFSWFHLLEGIAVTLMGYIDSLMLAPLAKDGLSSLSIYRNALFIATVMIMPLRAISASAFPVLNQAYVDQTKGQVQDLFHRVGLNTQIVGIGMFILIACNLDNAIMIFPPGYEQVKPVTLILMLGRLIHMASGMSNELISFSPYYKYNFRISLILLLLVILFNRLLIPQYGIIGAAWSATLAFTLYNIAKLIFIWKKMHLTVFTKEVVRVIISGIVAGIAGSLLPFIFHPIIDVIIRTIVIATIYSSMLLWISPDTDFSKYIINTIRKIYAQFQ